MASQKEQSNRKEYVVSNQALQEAITGLATTSDRGIFRKQLAVFTKAFAEYLTPDIRVAYEGGNIAKKATYTKLKGRMPVAMAMIDTIQCVEDFERTYRLVQGLRQAVRHLQERDEQAIVIDAGSGSGLGALLAAELGAETIAIENNSETFKALKDITERAGKTNKIQLINDDATEMQLEQFDFVKEGKKANILFSETESTAKDEAFEPIRFHLSSVLKKDALIVPGATQLAASVCYIDSETKVSHDAFHRFPGAKYIDDEFPFVQYGELIARKGDPIPEINSIVELPQPISSVLPKGKKLGIVLRMRIKMSANIPNLPTKEEIWLEPNEGNFLGQDWVFPVEGEPTNALTKIQFNFPTATSIDLLKARIVGDTIYFYKHPEEKIEQKHLHV